MAFPENLQFIRAQAGVTQEQLAEQLEVSRQSVSRWEGGQSFPEMDTLLRICDLYDVNLDTLLRGSVEESRVEDTARYDQFMSRFARRMAISIGGIIAGAGLCPLLDTLGVPEMLISAAMLLTVTICVVVIVATGIQFENFRRRYPVIADFYSQEKKDAFHQTFVWYITGGVGTILFGVTLLMLFSSVFPEQEPYESYGASLFLLMIAGAVTSFVYAGINNEKYEIWKYNRNNNPTPEAKRRLNLIGAIQGAMMTLVTAVYVGLGLSMNLWRTTWWIFAVAGILCGVVSIVLDPYKGKD
ncbi:MAG: helix-turn-helix transcriptional regulator [Oscillibacter sp.]|jgi:transcriptional regulator with XRE-family HTH domain|nr:helix-turn-helix transcriptional regulator [uncultured Oscillibacter sp.]MCI8812980.1 helix-turn-helix transcriptional regulator [Oscillibacter sp.]